MKKIISLIICIIFVFSLVACGDKTTTTNKDGSDGNFTSSSEDYFEWDDNLIVGLTDKGLKQKELVIPERCEGFNGSIFAEKENTVEKVSFAGNNDVLLNGVFTGAKNIKIVSLPEGLTKISNMDFWLCESLEEINIPSSVTTIGEAAFQKCSNLKKVVFGDKLSEIQEYAFESCSSLDTIVFSDTIETIGEYAFYECTNLKKITLPKALKNVGAFAFANGALEEITIPEEVQLESYDTTSFVQTNSTVKVTVTSGSWIDNNFDSVFENGYIKEIK